MRNSFYSATIEEFLLEDCDSILGKMAHENHFPLEITQRNAWLNEIIKLKEVIPTHWKNGRIIFEYTIPRLGKRIDVVILLHGIIFVLEFKVNALHFNVADKFQAENYAIDLNCFHKSSRNRIVVPILVATRAAQSTRNSFIKSDDYIYDPLESNGNDLVQIMEYIISQNTITENNLDFNNSWEYSKYLPTPTIIEAATSLYNQHNVTEIANCESEGNIDITSNKILSIIHEFEIEKKGRKAICFVTGVPGAGKTLVGLNIANAHHASGGHAVYLSGNAPLVQVLTEALTRDTNNKINPETGKTYTKSQARKRVEAFIQLVHHYRDTTLKKLIKDHQGHYQLSIDENYVRHEDGHGFAEVESVAIFDEAQRAWTKDDLCKFLGDNDFPKSESGFFIWSMDLRKDFAVIVCLVGNGQEINHGEGGIKEWIKALVYDFPQWEIHLSKSIIDNELSEEPELLSLLNKREKVFYDEDLHLRTSIRSLRSEQISELVGLILDHKTELAKDLYEKVSKRYPIVLTRSINKAKEWLRKKSIVENIDIWLTKNNFKGSIKEWLIEKCNDETIINFLIQKIPLSSTKKWILDNYPEGNNKQVLIQAINAKGGTCYDRVVQACSLEICQEYFRYKCPLVEIRSWLEKELSDTCEEKEYLMNEIPEDFRYGLIASSGAKRLKALGIEVKNEKEVSVPNWFLDDTEDIRSSNFMEEVVSEFVVQGLELDYTGVIWDADFRSEEDCWTQYNFVGSSWNKKSLINQSYQLNAYRVLLTRARLGMIIVVPEGDSQHIDGTIDKTRLPEFYDGTYNYLKSLGFEEI